MKILVLSHEFPPIGGGGSNACFYLTKEYVLQGHEVTVVTASYLDEKREEDINGVHVIRVAALRKQIEKSTFVEMFSYLLSAWFRIKKIPSIEKYDICQVFFGIPSGPLAAYIKWKKNVPYIIRFGGGDIPGTQKRFGLMYKLLGPILKSIWHNASALVANSDGLKERAIAFENRYPIQCICNGVDTELFFDDEKDINKGEIYVLFVSRLLERKGLQDLLPSLKEVSTTTERIIGKKTVLHIVGEGPYHAQLESLIDELSIKDIVIFEGQKTKEEVIRFYQQADYFVLPSHWEGMPNVVLEAMASKLPIIMTECEGSRELIKGNGYALSVNEFSEKMIELGINEELRKKLGYKSREIVEKEFTWNKMAQEYLILMQECINHK